MHNEAAWSDVRTACLLVAFPSGGTRLLRRPPLHPCAHDIFVLPFIAAENFFRPRSSTPRSMLTNMNDSEAVSSWQTRTRSARELWSQPTACLFVASSPVWTRPLWRHSLLRHLRRLRASVHCGSRIRFAALVGTGVDRDAGRRYTPSMTSPSPEVVWSRLAVEPIEKKPVCGWRSPQRFLLIVSPSVRTTPFRRHSPRHHRL